jgi:hypothetical protein
MPFPLSHFLTIELSPKADSVAQSSMASEVHFFLGPFIVLTLLNPKPTRKAPQIDRLIVPIAKMSHNVIHSFSSLPAISLLWKKSIAKIREHFLHYAKEGARLSLRLTPNIASAEVVYNKYFFLIFHCNSLVELYGRSFPYSFFSIIKAT